MCNADGSIDNSCDANGQCSCNTNVVGEKCDACAEGVVDFPSCDKCAENFYHDHEHDEHDEGDHSHDHHHGDWYHECKPCECNAEGSESLQCDDHGKCPCKPNIAGDKCDKSVPGYFEFPNPKGVYIFC